jgi:hypothetical protein
MFDNKFFTYSTDPKTKEGIDRLVLALEFLKIINADDVSVAVDNFFTWLADAIKRPILEEEKQGFYNTMLKYVQSEPISNDRSEAMTSIFNTEFLK